MGTVHDYAVGPLLHERDVAKVDNQIVVSKTIAPLCEPNFLRAGLATLLYGETHVVSGEELRLFDVYHATGARSGHQ